MIGFIIIRVAGYGMALFFLVICFASVGLVFTDSAKYFFTYIGMAGASAAAAMAFAALTRFLSGDN